MVLEARACKCYGASSLPPALHLGGVCVCNCVVMVHDAIANLLFNDMHSFFLSGLSHFLCLYPFSSYCSVPFFLFLCLNVPVSSSLFTLSVSLTWWMHWPIACWSQGSLLVWYGICPFTHPLVHLVTFSCLVVVLGIYAALCCRERVL